MKDFLLILGVLILCFEVYRLFRENWIRRFLKKKKDTAQTRNPRVMKPKSERDCPFCVKDIFVRTQIVDISGSPMKASTPWLDTAAMESKKRFET